MITDLYPDTALFVGGFKDANKSKYLLKYFVCLLRTVGTFTTVFEYNKSLRNHKIIEIKVFLKKIWVLMEKSGSRSGSGSVQLITYPDPNPEGQKLTDPDVAAER